MPCSCRWHYSGLCLQCHVPAGDTILDSVFMSCCLRWPIFWTVNVSSGDTILDSLFDAVFLFWTLSSMPCSLQTTVLWTMFSMQFSFSWYWYLTILKSVFNAMFLHGDAIRDSFFQCHAPSGDTILNSVYNNPVPTWWNYCGLFLQVTLFWALFSMPCAFKWLYPGLCFLWCVAIEPIKTVHYVGSQ